MPSSVSQNTKVYPSLRAEIIEVTPEKASHWLESNNKNRGILNKYVSQYADMMNQGEWSTTCDAIGFDCYGRLMNGQHRLHAIEKSGCTQTFVVVYGLDPDSFDRHDTGRPRNSAQILEIEGYENCTRLAATIRLLMGFEDEKTYAGARSDVQPMSSLAYAEMHGDPLTESVYLAEKAYREGPSRLARPSILAFVHYAMRHRSEDKAWDFIYGISTGIGVQSTSDARYHMRERLISESSKVSTFDRNVEVALMTKAANKFFAGEEVKQLRWSPGAGESFPKPEVGPDYPFGFFE